MTQVQDNNSTATANPDGFASSIMEVSKKVDGKYVKLAEHTIYTPTLDQFGFTVEVQTDAEGKPIIEDSLPVYKDDKLNWLQGCVFAAVKAQARNKLQPKLGILKEGAKIADNWLALITEGERGGGGDALAAIREAKASFAKWVAGLNKSAATQKTLISMFSNREGLEVQTVDFKAKMAVYLMDYATSLEAAQLERFQKYLTTVQDACGATVEIDDF